MERLLSPPVQYWFYYPFQSSVMKVTEVPKSSKIAKEGKPKFKPEHIDSSSCCGRCFYNVPSGTFLWLLPALMMLIMGIILIVLDWDGVWYEGLLQVSTF